MSVLARSLLPFFFSCCPSRLAFLSFPTRRSSDLDLFRCEPATLRSHWVLVVMDQFTRRIIGFGVHAGTVDGGGVCVWTKVTIRSRSPMSEYIRQFIVNTARCLAPGGVRSKLAEAF